MLLYDLGYPDTKIVVHIPRSKNERIMNIKVKSTNSGDDGLNYYTSPTTKFKYVYNFIATKFNYQENEICVHYNLGRVPPDLTASDVGL